MVSFINGLDTNLMLSKDLQLIKLVQHRNIEGVAFYASLITINNIKDLSTCAIQHIDTTILKFLLKKSKNLYYYKRDRNLYKRYLVALIIPTLNIIMLIWLFNNVNAYLKKCQTPLYYILQDLKLCHSRGHETCSLLRTISTIKLKNPTIEEVQINFNI